MSAIPDILIAVWVISTLSAVVIAMAQERPALRWMGLALLSGPVAPALLLARGAPLSNHGDAQLCTRCFTRLTGTESLCTRCRDTKPRPSRSAHSGH